MLTVRNLAGIISMSFLIAAPAQGRMNAWRIEARHAREELAEHHFDAAQKGYQRAMATLRTTNAKADELYDLTLLLAESYRAQGNLERARELLDGIQKEVEIGTPVDPTIAIRFWRRRAEVEFSGENKKKGLEYHRKVLPLLQRYFPQGSPAIRNRLLPLLTVAAEELDLETFNYLCDMVGKEEQQTDKNLESFLQGAYDNLKSQIFALVNKGNPSSAYRIVHALSNNNCFQKKKDDLWIEYAKACFGSQRSADAMLAIPDLENQIKQIGKKPRSNEDTRKMIELCQLMALIYESAGNSKKQDLQWQRVISLTATLKPPHLQQDNLRLSRALNRLGTKPQKDQAKALESLQLSLKLSACPSDCKKTDPLYYELLETHLQSRGLLGYAYVAANDPDKAEATLQSVSSQLLDVAGKHAHLHFGVLYLHLAKLFLKDHRIDRAEACLAKAKRLTETTPADKDRTDVLEMCKTVADLIATEKRNTKKEGNGK